MAELSLIYFYDYYLAHMSHFQIRCTNCVLSTDCHRKYVVLEERLPRQMNQPVVSYGYPKEKTFDSAGNAGPGPVRVPVLLGS